MKKNISSTLVSSLYKAISCQGERGEFPAGHNGPYLDKETPVRNTSHWLMVMAYVYSKVSNDVVIEDSANKAIDYLLKEKSIRPSQATYFCRFSEGKDKCNGLIGQAWVAEALAEAGSVFNRREAVELARNILSLHPFNAEHGIWSRVEPDGEVIETDPTFNHQLWFAAICSRYGDSSSIDKSKVFLDKVLSKVQLYPNGVIFHKSMLGDEAKKAASKGRGKSLVLSNLRNYRDWFKLYKKSVGYHGFNLYAIRILKEEFPGHYFWLSSRFRRISKAMLTTSFEKNLSALDYGYNYNPSGLEIAYFLEGEERYEEAESWVNKQFIQTYDAASEDLLIFGVPDKNTSSARIYEAVRLVRDYSFN